MHPVRVPAAAAGTLRVVVKFDGGPLTGPAEAHADVEVKRER
jgi:hypothetical protein